MEIKDVFFSVGIVFTLIVSLFTLSLGFKNRRNTLREHLYKEQIIFFSRFLFNVNKLNFEIEGLINNPDKRIHNDFYEKLDMVSNEYYNFEFLLTDEISGLINNLIFKANKFYTCFLGLNNDRINRTYSEYFDSYSSMLEYVKEFIGTNELSRENKVLHSQKDKISKNNILKLIIEISEKAVTSRL